MISSGTILKGRYEILDELGRGGMAVVYRIMDHTLQKQAALKMLKDSLQKDESYLKKFIREAQAAAKLTHPNIVDVYDVDQDQGHWFIVMELIEGVTLKQYIQNKGRLSSTECISISMQAADALNTAHQAGIIHRDIKPDNIIITREGNVKISDFGIARMQSSDTMTVDACGSVYYSSPEQVRGGYSDQRTDIYSLGVTMYEMCTGRLPFVGNSVVEIAMHHMEGKVIPPQEMYPDIPTPLNNIILKAMSRRMDDRYQTMAALVQDLKLCIKHPEAVNTQTKEHVDAGGKTVIFTHKQVEEIKEGLKKEKKNLQEKKKEKAAAQETRRQKKKVAEAKKKATEAKKKKQKKTSSGRQKSYKEPEYDRYDEEDNLYEEAGLAAGLQRALNIGLIVIILIVILFVLEFVFSALGMFKGITEYLPSIDHFGEWMSRMSEKMNSLHIGKYLGDGVKRIMEIFKR